MVVVVQIGGVVAPVVKGWAHAWFALVLPWDKDATSQFLSDGSNDAGLDLENAIALFHPRLFAAIMDRLVQEFQLKQVEWEAHFVCQGHTIPRQTESASLSPNLHPPRPPFQFSSHYWTSSSSIILI